MFGDVAQPFCVRLEDREILDALVLMPTMNEKTQDRPFYGTIIPRLIFALNRPIQILNPGLLIVEMMSRELDIFPDDLTLKGESRWHAGTDALFPIGDNWESDQIVWVDGQVQNVVYAQTPELSLDAVIVKGTITREYFPPIQLDSPHIIIPMMHRDNQFQANIVPDEAMAQV